jgi:hypothetical protein
LIESRFREFCWRCMISSTICCTLSAQFCPNCAFFSAGFIGQQAADIHTRRRAEEVAARSSDRIPSRRGVRKAERFWPSKTAFATRASAESQERSRRHNSKSTDRQCSGIAAIQRTRKAQWLKKIRRRLSPRPTIQASNKGQEFESLRARHFLLPVPSTYDRAFHQVDPRTLCTKGKKCDTRSDFGRAMGRSRVWYDQPDRDINGATLRIAQRVGHLP